MQVTIHCCVYEVFSRQHNTRTINSKLSDTYNTLHKVSVEMITDVHKSFVTSVGLKSLHKSALLLLLWTPKQYKGGFPVIAKITRRYVFTKGINHAITRSQYLNGEFLPLKLSVSVFCHDRQTGLKLIL